MGLFDSLKKKREELIEEKKKQQQTVTPEGKYNEPCALCGGNATEKKWMGQYWHRKCLRQTKKASKKMI